VDRAGTPADGYFAKRTAEARLRELLHGAGRAPSSACPGVAFDEAAAEWLRFIEEDRERKPSTLTDYRNVLRSRLLPAFGDRPLKAITPKDIEQWRRSLTGLSNRAKTKPLIQLHGIFRRAQTVRGVAANPLARVEKHPMRSSGDIQVFSPEEVWALVRAATSQLDGAIFLTAAFTGLRLGELLALHWRDVDFASATIRVRASWAGGVLTTPKSGKVRAVPLAPDVANRARTARPTRALDRRRRPGVRLGDRRVSRRLGAPPPLQGGPRCGGASATPLSRPAAYVRHPDDRQGRHPPRGGVDGPRRHQTTMKYLHYAPRDEDARLVAEAFALPEAASADPIGS